VIYIILRYMLLTEREVWTSCICRILISWMNCNILLSWY
jgi:hypothetical protein